MLEAADVGADHAGMQGLLLRHGQHQLGRDVGREEVAEVGLGQPLVVDAQAKTGAVLVGGLQVHGAGAHQPVAGVLGLQRQGGEQCGCG